MNLNDIGNSTLLQTNTMHKTKHFISSSMGDNVYDIRFEQRLEDLNLQKKEIDEWRSKVSTNSKKIQCKLGLGLFISQMIAVALLYTPKNNLDTADPDELAEINLDLDYLMNTDRDLFNEFSERSELFKKMQKVDKQLYGHDVRDLIV